MATKTAKRLAPKAPLVCTNCGEISEDDEDVLEDSGLCRECEEEHVYCQVCNAWYDRAPDYPCDHLTWVDGYGFAGCGDTGVSEESYRECVLELLHRFPHLAQPALQALKRNALRVRCSRCGDEYELRDGSAVIATVAAEPLDRDESEDLRLAMAWVFSLDGAKTQWANRLTAQWLRGYPAWARGRADRLWKIRVAADKNVLARAKEVMRLTAKTKAEFLKLPRKKIEQALRKLGITLEPEKKGE